MILESAKLLKSIKPYIPSRVLPLAGSAYRTYMGILCWYTSLWDRRYVEKTGFARIPPASLRYRVHGSPDVEGFLKVGKRCSEDIEAALEKIGKNFDSFRNVLDFGCGCGRTLIWFGSPLRSAYLYGTDIDAEAISWCRNNLDFAGFSVNNPLPPLEYPSETFDLIYAISVFTHLDEDYQFRWLDELKRVTKSKGIVLLTVHGPHAWKSLPREDIIQIEQKGFKFISSNIMKGIFPEWYQNAYHTKEYVLDRYSKYFDVLDYIPKGMSNLQDMVVLQKP
jgi:SAM-dependent methyltransferase